MSRILSFLMLALSLLSFPASAVLVDDLYRVERQVADQSTAERLQGFNLAFKDLLLKLSGSDEYFAQSGLQRPLSNSARYVYEFSYQMRKQPGETEGEPDVDALFLIVTFNRDLVEALLRENAIPLWGRERPSSLMLIHYSEPSQVGVLVSGDTVPQVVEEFDEIGLRKGLPLLFPLLDLEDRAILGAAIDVLPDALRMQELAERYTADVLVSALMESVGETSWQARWQAKFSDKVFNWSSQAASRELLIEQSLTQLARILASEYALRTDEAMEGEVLFKVQEVRDVREYIKVLSYLQSLDAIESAGLVKIEGQQATFRVKLRNSAEDLNRLIGLGYVLEQLELPLINAAEDTQIVRLNYRLIH